VKSRHASGRARPLGYQATTDFKTPTGRVRNTYILSGTRITCLKGGRVDRATKQNGVTNVKYPELIEKNGKKYVQDQCPHCFEPIIYDPTKDFTCPHCGSTYWGEPDYWEL
jgi:hypothetical protein